MIGGAIGSGGASESVGISSGIESRSMTSGAGAVIGLTETVAGGGADSGCATLTHLHFGQVTGFPASLSSTLRRTWQPEHAKAICMAHPPFAATLLTPPQSQLHVPENSTSQSGYEDLSSDARPGCRRRPAAHGTSMAQWGWLREKRRRREARW